MCWLRENGSKFRGLAMERSLTLVKFGQVRVAGVLSRLAGGDGVQIIYKAKSGNWRVRD